MGDNGVTLSIGGLAGLAYPHLPDSGLLFAPVALTELAAIRSRAMPGLYQPLHLTPLAYLDTFTGMADFPGRTFQAFDMAATTVRCQAFFDITGPWR
jgi:hypothetical protein